MRVTISARFAGRLMFALPPDIRTHRADAGESRVAPGPGRALRSAAQARSEELKINAGGVPTRAARESGHEEALVESPCMTRLSGDLLDARDDTAKAGPAWQVDPGYPRAPQRPLGRASACMSLEGREWA